MSGHSKWSKIKRAKGEQDAKRGKVFTRLIREITTAARMGGSDPGSNPRLRHGIELARAENMPNDNVTKAIKRGTGELEGVHYEEISYEGYGPHGVAIMVHCLTDNRNRTVSEVRFLFSKFNGSLAESGSVSWMFKRKGVITIPRDQVEENKLMELVLDFDVDDVQSGSDFYDVVTSPDAFDAVCQKLKSSGIKWESAKITGIAENDIPLKGDAAASVIRFLHSLEELEDVQEVVSNLDVDEKDLEQIIAAQSG